MDCVIKEFIQCLRDFNEQLEKLTAIRRRVQPDFNVTMNHTYIFDNSFKFLYFSTAAANFIGIDPKDAEGMHLREISISEIVPNIEYELQAVFETGNVVKGKTKELATPIGVKYYEYTLSPIYTAARDIGAVLCTTKDITEETLSQNLSNQISKFTKFVELCPLGIVIINKDANIVMINQAYSKFFSMEKSELMGKPIRMIAELLGISYAESRLVKALEGVETRQDCQKSNRGQFFRTCFPLKDDHTGEVLGAVGIYHDLNDYERLRREITRLDRLNLVGEMAAGVAHEIRNPLTVVKGYLQFLRKKVPSEMAENFDLILSELGRVEQLVIDFISLAKDKPSEVSQHNINTIVEEIVPLIQTAAIKQDIELNLKLCEDLPKLYLDEKEIKQLTLNLAKNGIEAMEKNGVLTIETSAEIDGVKLQISDTGCGIDEKHIDKIFDPFFTLKESGTGLGLSVSAGIVRRHNGSISVQTEKGRGTCFAITFPTQLNFKL